MDISKQFDELCKEYENFIQIGELNSELCEDAMNEFCCIYNLKNLVNKPTTNGIIFCQKIKDGSKLRVNSIVDCAKIK